MTFDIYNRLNSEYKLPGPPVAKLTSASSVNGVVNRQTSQTEGQRPDGCICENGNWCGKEVPDYNSESSCWASAENCWKQADDCWGSAGPTGNAGCQLWQTKCEGLQSECRAGRFNGPPNKGQVLTPPQKTIDVGLVLATQGGGVAASPNTAAAPAPKPSADVQQKQPEKPSSSPAQAAAPAPTLDFKPNEGVYAPESPAASEPPKQTSVTKNPSYEQGPAPTSDTAPAPTQGPGCKPGHPCVTVTQTVVKTEIVYVTAYAHQRRAAGFHYRRR